MSEKAPKRPLKVCSTCRYWTYQFKGFCLRLNQGVGKFWICEDWAAPERDPEARAERPAPPGPQAP